MKWIKLDKKALDSLRVHEKKFLVCCNEPGAESQFIYDIITYIELPPGSFTDEEMKYCWDSQQSGYVNWCYSFGGKRVEYNDDELMDFTHYALLELPEDKNA